MPNIQPQITKCLLLSFVPLLSPTQTLVSGYSYYRHATLALQVCLPGMSFKAGKEERNKEEREGEGKERRKERGKGVCLSSFGK